MFLKKSSIFFMLGILATASQAHAEVIISPDGNQVKAGNVIINNGNVNLSRRRSTRIKKYDRYGRLIKTTTVPSIIRSTPKVEIDGDEEYSTNRQVIRSTRSTGSARSTTVQSTTVNGSNRTVINNTSSDY